jgi:hypothetical protein
MKTSYNGRLSRKKKVLLFMCNILLVSIVELIIAGICTAIDQAIIQLKAKVSGN